MLPLDSMIRQCHPHRPWFRQARSLQPLHLRLEHLPQFWILSPYDPLHLLASSKHLPPLSASSPQSGGEFDLCRGIDWGCQDPSLVVSSILGSMINESDSVRADSFDDTFLATFLCFRCFAALAFSILCRNRTGVRLDLGSELGQKGLRRQGFLRLTARFIHHCCGVIITRFGMGISL